MSKQTLYGSKQRRVITPHNGTRFRGRLLTKRDKAVLKLLREEAYLTLTETVHASDEFHWLLWDAPRWEVRVEIARCSDKYHKQYVTDESTDVRFVVATYSDKYHAKFKDDKDWEIRRVVAEYSDKYYVQFKDDPAPAVRAVVAYRSMKYNKQLINDKYELVRRAASITMCNFMQDAEDSSIQQGVAALQEHAEEIRDILTGRTNVDPFMERPQGILEPQAAECRAGLTQRARATNGNIWERRALTRYVPQYEPGVSINTPASVHISTSHEDHVEGLAEGTWYTSRVVSRNDIKEAVYTFLDVNGKYFDREAVQISSNCNPLAGTWYCVLNL